MQKKAKFNIGDLVVHKYQGYRAVIIDVDPLFQCSGLYNPQAFTRDFSQSNPWYRLLIDNSSQITYVKEEVLIHDLSRQHINNPNLHLYLVHDHGTYRAISRGH